MTGSKPAKRRRLHLSEDVKLVIGSDDKEGIIVHKSVLTKTSAFFRSCRDGHDWEESTTKTMQLPEEEPKVLDAYLRWLYAGEVIATEDDVLIDGAASEELAVLADRFEDTAFLNAVPTTLVVGSEKLRMSPGSRVVNEFVHYQGHHEACRKTRLPESEYSQEDTPVPAGAKRLWDEQLPTPADLRLVRV